MRFHFHNGMPEGCVEWLWENVGSGNLSKEFYGSIQGRSIRENLLGTDAWFYERAKVPRASGDDPYKYVPTIAIDDEKLAILFSLRWL